MIFPPQTRLLSSYCRPSLLAELTSEHMNNPPVVTLSHLEMTTLIDHGIHTLLEMPLPCSLNLVNLRTVWVAQDLTLVKALMVVQHAGVDCNFSEVHMPCEVKVSGDVFLLSLFGLLFVCCSFGGLGIFFKGKQQ